MAFGASHRPGFLIIVPPLVSIYGTGSRIRLMERRVSLTKTVNPVAGCVLAFLSTLTLLFAGGGGYYFQIHLNAVWSAAAAGVRTNTR